jgi:hypothetical protein
MAEAILLGKDVGTREPAGAEEAAPAPVQEAVVEGAEPVPAEQGIDEQAAEVEAEPMAETTAKVKAETLASVDTESEFAEVEQADDAGLLEAAEAILRGEPLPVHEAEELQAPVETEELEVPVEAEQLEVPVEAEQLEVPVEAPLAADERAEPEPQVAEQEPVALAEETPPEPVQTGVTEQEPEEKIILRRTTPSKPERADRRVRPRYQYVRDERLEALDQPDQKSRRRKRRRLVLDEETGELVSQRRHKREDDQETVWED